MFVTLMSFRGTFKSFWDLTEVSAQSWYKVCTYHLVNPTFKISLFLVSNSLLHICSNFSSCYNVFILLSLSGVTSLSLLAGVCAACMLAYRCLLMKWWAAVTVVFILSQKALFMCPYVSSGKFSVLVGDVHCHVYVRVVPKLYSNSYA